MLSAPMLTYNFIFHTKRRWLTVRTLLLSAVARVRIRFLPGPRLYPYLGERGVETPKEAFRGPQSIDIQWVAYKVSRVARRTPWESRCLVQAMVAQRLLRHYGLPSTVYLGVGRGEDGKMDAHAWVRCGERYVCGGEGEGYGTVACFAMYPQEERAHAEI